LHVEDAKDERSSDDDWEPLLKDSNLIKKTRRLLSRQKNITIEGDIEVYNILITKGFYRYLRRKVSGLQNTYSVKEAKQIVRNGSCFLAFALQQGNVNVIDITWEIILQEFRVISTESNVLYRYTEYLSKQYYKPSTITHNIDYIMLAMEWVVNEYSVKYSLEFNTYCRTHRSKVSTV